MFNSVFSRVVSALILLAIALFCWVTAKAGGDDGALVLGGLFVFVVGAFILMLPLIDKIRWEQPLGKVGQDSPTVDDSTSRPIR